MYDLNLIRDADVVQGGKISPFGTIGLLNSGISNLFNSECEPGLRVYSDALLPYRNGLFRAINTTRDIRIYQGDKLIEDISFDKFFVVHHSGKYEVRGGGYLVYAKTDRLDRKFHGEMRRIFTAKILRDGAAGKPTPFRDNSPFYQVDPSLRKKIVTLLVCSLDEQIRVIDSKGNIIPVKETHPLAFFGSKISSNVD